MLLTNKTRIKDNNKTIKIRNAVMKSDLILHRAYDVKRLIWLIKNLPQPTYLEKLDQSLIPFQKYGR